MLDVLLKIMEPEYDDTYPACADTHSTLRVYHDHITPSEITSILGVQPTSQMIKGDKDYEAGGNFELNGWFLSSSDEVESFDSRRHIDWIVDQIVDKKKEILRMIQDGFRIDISSFWISSSGNGGPTLSPYQMSRLADLQIETFWDVYFSGDDYS